MSLHQVMYLNQGPALSSPPSSVTGGIDHMRSDHSIRSGSSPDSPSSQILHHHHANPVPLPPPPPPPHHHPYHHHLQPGSMSPTYHHHHHHLNHLHHQGFFSYEPNFQVFVDNSVHPMSRMDAVVKNESEFKTHSDIESDHMSSDPHFPHIHHHQHDQQSMHGSDPSSPQQMTPTSITLHPYQTEVTGTTASRPVPARSPYEWMSSSKKCNSTSSSGGGNGGTSQPAPGKTRTRDKYRVVYSDHQRVELEKEFHYSKYITIRRKAELAQNLALSERQVKIWFQNRRAKERKLAKKREEGHKKQDCKNTSNSENNNGNNNSSNNGTNGMSLHPMYLSGNTLLTSSTGGPPGLLGTTLIDHMRDHPSVRGSPDSPSSSDLMHTHHILAAQSVAPPPLPPPPPHHPSHAYHHHHPYHHHLQSAAPVSMSPPTHHLNHLHHQAGLFSYVNEPSLQAL